jgi:hypothetical protein
MAKKSSVKGPALHGSRHPFVYAVQQALKDHKYLHHGQLRSPHNSDESYLDIRSSPECLPRLLNFADSLLQQLEARGYTILNKDGWDSCTTVTILGQEVGMKFSERLHQVLYRDTPDGKWEASHGGIPAFRSKYGMAPSGVLQLVVYNPPFASYRTTVWSDKPKKGLLENQLDDIVNGMEVLARKWKIEQEERERRWKEAAEKREAEARIKAEREAQEAEYRAMIESLHNNARLWEECDRMRRYIDAIEQSAQGSSREQDLCDWIRWARAYIESIDPILNQQR